MKKFLVSISMIVLLISVSFASYQIQGIVFVGGSAKNNSISTSIDTVIEINQWMDYSFYSPNVQSIKHPGVYYIDLAHVQLSSNGILIINFFTYSPSFSSSNDNYSVSNSNFQVFPFSSNIKNLIFVSNSSTIISIGPQNFKIISNMSPDDSQVSLGLESDVLFSAPAGNFNFPIAMVIATKTVF